jgi:altered-inheritance-of-mitochondria protein 5
MKDLLKHRWNEEVQTLARKAVETRWEDVRDTAGESWKVLMRLVKKE